MKKLERAYYYVFYMFYKMMENAPFPGLTDFRAGLCVSALEVFLWVSLIIYYNVFIDKRFDLKLISAATIIPALIIIGTKIFFFVYKDNWKEYIVVFDQLPKRINRMGSRVVFGMVLILLTNLFFAFYLMGKVDWTLYR